MSSETAAPVEVECRDFCRYLANAEPSAYVMSCYVHLIASAGRPSRASEALIERCMLGVGSWGTIGLQMADGYSRIFRPRSLLRRKLILMVAILENSPVTERPLNSGDEGSLLGVGARLMLTLTTSVLLTLAGTLVLGPVHLVSMLRGTE